MIKTLVCGLFAAVAAAAAAPDYAAELEAARVAWGVGVQWPVAIERGDLGGCNRLGANPSLAIIRVEEIKSWMRFEGAPAVESVSYKYRIVLNEACAFSPKLLQNTITHEYGHMLLGAAYHSGDKKSIMYPVVKDGRGQQVTQADYALAFTTP
jgi:hypothetical protein